MVCQRANGLLYRRVGKRRAIILAKGHDEKPTSLFGESVESVSFEFK
jgi:hypothetical protein